MAGTKVKTKVSNLKWVFITGEGRNQAMPGDPERMQYLASAIMPKDGEAHKHLLGQIKADWENYKSQYGVKGLPKTNGIKDEMKDDPSGVIDPATEKVKKIPTGNVVATFKTNTAWPDGNKQIVKVKDRKGADITTAVHNAEWSIGDGSTGILHGTAMSNNAGGTHKVTLYLAAVQLAKLVKYEGNEVVCDEIEGDDIDLGDEVAAIETETEPEGAVPEL